MGPPVPPSADPSARQKQPAGRLAAGGSGARAEPAAWHAHGPGPPLLSHPSCTAPPDTTSVTSDPPWGRQRCTLFPRGNRRTGTWRPSASCLLSCLRKSRSSSCARWSSPGSALNHGDKPSPQALGGAVTGRPKPPGEGRPPKPDSALRACLLPVPDCGVPRGTEGEALKAPTSCPGRHWEQAARLPPGLEPSCATWGPGRTLGPPPHCHAHRRVGPASSPPPGRPSFNPHGPCSRSTPCGLDRERSHPFTACLLRPPGPKTQPAKSLLTGIR